MLPRFPVPKSGWPCPSKVIAYTISCAFDQAFFGAPSASMRYTSEPPAMEDAPWFRVGGGLRGGLTVVTEIAAGVTCSGAGAGLVGCGAESGVLLPTPAA